MVYSGGGGGALLSDNHHDNHIIFSNVIGNILYDIKDIIDQCFT